MPTRNTGGRFGRLLHDFLRVADESQIGFNGVFSGVECESRFETLPHATVRQDLSFGGNTMTYKEAYAMCCELNRKQSSVVFLPKIPGLRPVRRKAKPNRRKELILDSERQGSQIAKYLRR